MVRNRLDYDGRCAFVIFKSRNATMTYISYNGQGFDLLSGAAHHSAAALWFG
jgi:hypothetical protein